MDEILRLIRTDLRRSMDGIISKSMRDKGLDYKLNFGVNTVRLQSLAQRYEPGVALAEMLWKQETRELKILATMLFPIEEFTPEHAERWATEIHNQEIREQVCVNLFQELGFADKLVAGWINSEDEETRTTGYWLLARLILRKSELVDSIDIASTIDSAISDLGSQSYFLRNAAQNALKFMGRTSTEISRQILDGIGDFGSSEDPLKKEIYDSLTFEFSEFGS